MYKLYNLIELRYYSLSFYLLLIFLINSGYSILFNDAKYFKLNFLIVYIHKPLFINFIMHA